jgi:AhpD family alkylhydroperoxidase
MPRIPLLTDAQVGWFTRAFVFRAARRRFREVPEPLRAAANHPGLMWANVVHELMVEKASRRLDPALRDIVVHRVATLVGCSWCVDFGTMLALHHGLSVERHRELGHYRESSAFTPAERVALEYADAMTAQPTVATDELVERVRTHVGDAGLVELTYLIALENMRARINHALGLTAQGYTNGDACPMPFDEQIRRAAPEGV